MTGMEPFIAASLLEAGSAAAAGVGSAAAGATAATGMSVGTMAGIAGTGLGALGTIQQTNAQSAMADANSAAQMRRGGEERAASQAQAYQLRHKTDLVLGQEQADLAASGGGMGGSGAELLAGTAGRGKYNEEMALWGGEERARGLEDAAAVTRFAGKQGRAALPLKLGAQVLTGVSKIGSQGGWGDWSSPEVADSVTDQDTGETINTYKPRQSRLRYVR